MRIRFLVSFVAVAAILSAGLAAQSAASDVERGADAEQIQRGRYLANYVAMCVQCHSPRDRYGKLLPNREFTGGPVPVESPFLGPRWAFTAPNIRRVPGYDRDSFVMLLTAGVNLQGRPPRAPMPPFRMTTADAEAIWAYLRTL